MKKTNTARSIGLSTSLALVLLPFFILCFYSHPVADDFTFSITNAGTSFFKTQVNEYVNWNGRYVSNILVRLNPITYKSFGGYQWVTLAMIAMLFFAFYFFTHAILDNKEGSWWKFHISAILTTLFLHQMPIVSEGIYWYTGASIYTAGCIITIVTIGLIIQRLQGRYVLNNRGIHQLLLFGCVTVSLGFNEVLTATIASLSLAFALFACCKHRTLFPLALSLLVVSIVLSMVVILAPGNEVRSSYFPQRHMLVHSLVYSFAQCARFFLSWITSIPLLLISLLYLEYHENMKPKIPLLEHSFHLTIVTAGALLFGILFICMFAPYWSTGILGQHRTANVAYFFFVPLWFINLSAWYNRYPRLFSRVKPRNEVQRNMIWILIIVSLLATRNTREAWFDLASGKAKAYDQQMKERREIIVSKQDTIWFDVIQRPPASIFVLDITNDPGHWINRGYNEYFKTEAKILPKDSTNRND